MSGRRYPLQETLLACTTARLPGAEPGSSSVHERPIPRSLLGRSLLSLQQQFEASQWWPPEQMGRNQFPLLTALLRHAFETVPFYRIRLASSGNRSGNTVTADL